MKTDKVLPFKQFQKEAHVKHFLPFSPTVFVCFYTVHDGKNWFRTKVLTINKTMG